MSSKKSAAPAEPTWREVLASLGFSSLREEEKLSDSTARVVALWALRLPGQPAGLRLKVDMYTDCYPTKQGFARVYLWTGSSWSLVWDCFDAMICQRGCSLNNSPDLLQRFNLDHLTLLRAASQILAGDVPALEVRDGQI